MRLDDRVTVLQGATTTDKYGETTESYSESDTVWAAVSEGTPSETRQGTVEEEQAAVTIMMRTPTAEDLGITSDSRLRWNGDTLRVQGIATDTERRGFTEIRTERVR